MSATLKDIAEELHISVTAVSRALRDMPDIGPETTKLVKQTAAHLGYRKNFAASYLKTAKSMMLGIIVPDICNPVFSSMYKGIEHICSETSYTLMLGNSNESPEEEIAIINNMLGHGVDGIFLVPTTQHSASHTKLEKVRIPYVVLQRKLPNLSTNFVQSNDFEGGYLVAKHLFHLGHRKFLYVSAPLHISSALDRYKGFLSYLTEQHVDNSAITVIECDATKAGGYSTFKEWIQKQLGASSLNVTAIFCFSDYVAYGVYSALKEYNLRIPEDLSVIGYDNIEYSDMISPPLTTVDIHPYEIGIQSGRMMSDFLKSNFIFNRNLESVLSPKLIIRNSTGISK